MPCCWGVSRQSVTKWEAERAYPEMDKLLRICQIFKCSLDDLVTVDVAASRAEAEASQAVPSASVANVGGGAGAGSADAAIAGDEEPRAEVPRATAQAAPGASALVIPDGPATDVCGYDEHMVKLARRTMARRSKLCSLIMIVATIVALTWLFFSAIAGAPGNWGYLFWLPWVIGGLSCGIVNVVVDEWK